MTATKKLLAFDLGAESGRGLVGLFDGKTISLDVVHRFPNGAVKTLDTMHWDVLGLYTEMLNGMRAAAQKYNSVDSVGVDTWGVDFALLGRNGSLLGNPRHYRDPHTENIMEEAFQKVPKMEIFLKTGIQFMQFNSLFQLLAMKRDQSPLLDVAENLLFMPDFFHYLFTGIKVNEFTDASTSQMIDPHGGNWAFDLIEKLELPANILGTIVKPGSVLGPLRPAIASETNLNPAQVVLPATHDTASAVAAVPATGNDWAYISSGTWSLMGVETDRPMVNEQAHQYNFTNEGGFGGTTRFLKNIMGLWLVQECRRIWKRDGQDFTYDQLVQKAKAAPAFVSLVNPDDASFLLPTSMPDALATFCKKTNQPAPQEPGAFVRCCLESLALRYRWVLEKLGELAGKKYSAIHIVGGGSQNALLNQLTADACNCPVYAGPVEATAIGNVLVQAVGLGVIGNLQEARDVVRDSFEVQKFEPKQPDAWEEPYQRFMSFI